MPKHDSFLLRIDPQVLKALKQWAADELRSANGQIEFLLREALVKAQRLPSVSTASGEGPDASGADSRGSKS
ncbi:MAG: hypothetical protein U0892_12505 [Pirellulales bacterium]